MIGTTLGYFNIESLLGTGGMGAVYRALDTKLGRGVAIKVLPDDVAADPERIARFEREARVLASLNHPNIAALHGMDHAGGRHFLIMELVEGETLADRLQRGPLAVEEALRIALQIAEGVEAAHERGVVHRDLKPANVKITPDEKVKVLDFGLAKAMDVGGAGEAGEAGKAGGAAALTHSPTLSMMATQAGMILGTAAYMSPEQAKGAAADHRSDIFSFGVVLYEMLIGRQPFQGETAPEILASVLIRDVDVNSLPPGLNPRLAEALGRCLNKSPKKRWQAIGDLRVELEAIAAAPRALPTAPTTVVAAQQQPLWRRAMPIAVAAIIFAAVGGGAVAWRMHTPPAPAAIVKFPIILPEDEQLTRPPGGIAISPDGSRIAYVANLQVYLRSMNEMGSHAIPGTNLDAFRPFFSPDGQWVGFYAGQDSTLKKIALTGGSPVTLYKTSASAGSPVTLDKTSVTATAIYGASWYGHQIVFADPTKGIMSVSDSGGDPKVLAEAKPPEVPEGPQMLDDDTLLFTMTTEAGPSRWDKAQIVVQSLRSGKRKIVFRGGTGRYVPTGHLVYALGATLFAVPFDRKVNEVRGGPVPVVEGVRRGGIPAIQSGIAAYAVSDSGMLAYLPRGAADASFPRTLAFVDRNGKAEPLPLPAQPYAHPRISPNGEQLAVNTDDGKDAVIWIYNLKTGGTLRRLTFGGRNLFPIWTPDGLSITFSSDREGDRGIFQQLADGSRPAERLTKAEGGVAQAPESWSPDGKTLVFRVGVSATSISLWTLTVGDKAPKRFDESIKAGHFNSSFSPDGRWLAYSSLELDSYEPRLFVQPFPRTDAKYQPVASLGTSAAWSHDGKQMFFDDGATTGRLMVMDVHTTSGFTAGNPVPISTAGIDKPFFSSRHYDVTPDGRKILITAVAQSDSRSAAAPRIEMNIVLNWFEELKARVPSP